ncbi:MAG: BON domain-containing protein [Burkholderiaceae bacterium]|nr:BON domain-containing protein [Burkholderiaceae bacterium]
MDLAYQYLVAQLQEALACDPRVGMQDLQVRVIQGRIHLMGEVTTEERRAAIDAVAQKVAPDTPIRNDVRVLSLGGAPKPEAIE